MKTQPETDRVDILFRAFSDRTRLRILNLLLGGERCVCDLVEILDVPQPTASRHLAYLRRARLVKARKEGLWSYYRLAPVKGPLHQKLIECLTSCVREAPELANDARKLKARANDRCC